MFANFKENNIRGQFFSWDSPCVHAIMAQIWASIDLMLAQIWAIMACIQGPIVTLCVWTSTWELTTKNMEIQSIWSHSPCYTIGYLVTNLKRHYKGTQAKFLVENYIAVLQRQILQIHSHKALKGLKWLQIQITISLYEYMSLWWFVVMHLSGALCLLRV